MERDERLEKLAQDLEQLKSAVSRSAIVMREVMGPWHYRALLVYAGIGATAISLGWHVAIRFHGSFAASPAWLRAVLVVVTALAVAGGGLVKALSVSRAARSVDRRLGFFSFFRRYYGPMVVHLYLPLALILLGASAWLLATGRGVHVVGAIGLFSGILMNLLAATFRQDEYLVFGYWLLVTAAASFLVPGLSPALWFAVIFGLGCLAFAAAGALMARRR